MGHLNIVNLIQTIEMTALVTRISGPLVDTVLLPTLTYKKNVSVTTNNDTLSSMLKF